LLYFIGKRKTRRFELHLFPGRGLAGVSSTTVRTSPPVVKCLAPQLPGSNESANVCEILYFWLDTAALSDANRIYRPGSAPGFASRLSWCSLTELASGTLFPSGGVVAGCATVGAGVSTAAREASRQPLIPIPANSPISIAAPAISGIQMRSTSLFSSCRSASTVFALLSREYVNRLLADST
jgi:hypothetical protein